ncbi:MAG TPA: LysR family transcriptional regulator, partial [Albitalea sp.]|nr:LysR family transcriptional regulator [Albitalea sp.]
MNGARQRPLSLSSLRAFEAVARRLSFSEAADELHVTQSAVSRQIKGLEDELGAPLFTRGTRHVELTGSGNALLRVVAPWLDRLDAGVRQIRQARGRRVVQLSTFPSFASLWLLPQMEAFQRDNPDLDIRVSAIDRMVDLDEPDLDIVLRYCAPQTAPPGAQRMFGEVITPVIGPRLADRIRAGESPPLNTPADLAEYTLTEEDDHRPSSRYLGWRHWLTTQGLPRLQPRRWLYLNFTYQQVQAALAGQGVALARVALVAEQLERGDLVEPFGAAGRI